MDEGDCVRVNEFRKLRKEVRGSYAYLIVDIDVAKHKNHAFFCTSTGNTLLKRLIFENTV